MNTPEEFGEVFAAYRYRIFSYLWLRTYNPALTEDLVSETFLKAWAAWPRYVDQGRLEKWLTSIAYRALIDYTRSPDYRRRAWAQDDTDGALNRAASGWAKDDLQQLENSEWVREQLARLTPKQRAVIFLDQAGYTGEEIAEMLNLQHGTVRALKMRGLHTLRRQLTAA